MSRTQVGTRLLGTGAIIHSVQSTTGVVVSTTSAIPADNTKPQITEGAEWITATITPKKIGNKIRARFSGSVTHGSVLFPEVAIALFKNSDADALASQVSGVGTTLSISHSMYLEYDDTVSSLSPATYRIRFGSSAGFLVYTNNGAAVYFNGTLSSALTLEEIAT